MKLKIGGKLMLAGSAIVVIPFALMGIIVSIKAQSGITKLVGDQLVSLTRSMTDYTESKIEGDLRTSLALAASVDVVDGVEAANRGGSATTKMISELSTRLASLSESDQYNSAYSGIIVMGATGVICSASKANYIGVNVAERDYFKASLEGKPFVSQMLINKVTNEATVAISAPVNGPSGKPIGSCAVFMKTAAITDEMAKFTLGKTGYIWVVDRAGLVVLHPDKQVALKVNVAQTDGMASVARNALADKTGIESYLYKGSRKTCAYAPVPSIGWKVLATIPENEFLATANAIRDLIVVVAIVAIVLAITLLYFLSRSISIPLKRGAVFAGAVADGDLTVVVKGDMIARGDELGDLARALNKMSQGLIRIVGDIHAASSNVAQGSEEISSTAQSMSQGATEQAASAEEVSSSVEEMAATIRQNADNALATEGIATKAVKDAEEGSTAVSASVAAMGEIAERISIIEEIARQTNLLALNAAIEAARAGESGKGFAVVASEVRKLAERSQKAASEITGLSKSTVELSQNAGKIIEAIVPDIKKTADLVQEIASASREQSAGVEQIGKAMIQLDTVIQQNASGSEEMAAMAEELSGQSQQLAATIGFFKLAEDSSAARRGMDHAGNPAAATLPAPAAPKPGRIETAPKTPVKAITRAIAPAGKAADSEFESF